MKGDPEQRALLLGEYIVEHGATVRAAARAFGCSKSTVHKDVSVRLRTVGPELFRQVQMALARNKAERHLRGGAATREKDHNPRQRKAAVSKHRRFVMSFGGTAPAPPFPAGSPVPG